MEVTFKTMYDHGDRVRHITKGSPTGIVTDVLYSVRDKNYKYKVAFGFANEHEVYLDEIEMESGIAGQNGYVKR